MRVEELMIGDWVRRRYITKPSGQEVVRDFRVTQIRRLFKDAEPDVWGDNGNMGTAEQMEPIPLTQEILEKNGWVSKRDGSGDFIYMRENTPGYGSNDMKITKNIIGNFQMIHGSFNGISVHYVHQLQHALRLCGIEKEIVL